MSTFLVLNQDEQDDIIVAFMLAQERDKCCHEMNLQRYDAMLAVLTPCKWRDRVVQLRDETAERLTEVNSIIGATISQMPTVERIADAKARL